MGPFWDERERARVALVVTVLREAIGPIPTSSKELQELRDLSRYGRAIEFDKTRE
jgi:hypothetical protein